MRNLSQQLLIYIYIHMVDECYCQDQTSSNPVDNRSRHRDTLLNKVYWDVIVCRRYCVLFTDGHR